MPDYRTTSNMLALLSRLEDTYTGALPVNQLAEELGVHRRTVIRWLTALEGEDLDGTTPRVRREHRDGVAWAVLTRTREPLSATIFQYAAVLAATRHLEAGGSLLAEGASDVLGRVEEGLAPSLRELVPRVAKAFYYLPFAPKDHSADEDVMDPLVRALVRRRRVEIDYRNASREDSKRCIEPWSMVMYKEGFYVLARSSGSAELRVYAVDRVLDVRLLDETFEVPDDFDPEAQFAASFGLWRSDASRSRIVIAFSAGAAVTVRTRRWRGFVSLDSGSDGRVYLVLDLPVTPDLVSWVVGWGPIAEVVEPPTLREQVVSELARALEQYGE